MRRKIMIGIAAAVCALSCLGAAACGGNGDSSGSEKLPPVEKIDIVNGFEEAGSEALFEGFAGAQISWNENEKFVNTGKKSVKISVSHASVPKFAFSENASQTDISEYEYLSFWMYVDGDSPISLSNTVNEGDYQGSVVLNRYYIKSSVEPNTWTKIKIEKGDAFYDNMMYYLPYGKFIFCGTGENFNAPLDYDVYIDDVRVYKKGMTGETELYVVDADNNNRRMDLPDGAVGRTYEIPKIQVLGADGSELFDAKPTVSVTDCDGFPVEIEDNSFLAWKAGVYTLTASYEKDGFVGRYNGSFRLKFVAVADTNTELAVVGKPYSVPRLTLLDPTGDNALEGARTETQVFDALGEEVPLADGKFTPRDAGCYTLKYVVSKSDHGVENTETYEKYVWASGIKGLVSDFSRDESAGLFCAADVSGLSFERSSLYAKYEPDQTGTSLSCIINSVSFPSFCFGEKFPYAKASESGIHYLSFWVYNDVGSDLYLISSGDLLNRQLLRSGLWNRVVFYTDSFSSSFDWKKNQFTVYGVDNAADRINGALYFDDLRIYRDGDVEEAAFSEQITTTDYNAATGEGVRFALNGSYRIDFRVFGLDGTLLEGEESSVLWVKDSNGANMVVNGGSFTPAREGWHTLSLYYEKDGIHNSVIKKFYVRPQLEFNPDTDARDSVLPYGEAETVYNADSFRPVLWNKGKVAEDGDVKYSLTVTDGSGKKVETNGLVFTPMKKGLYNLSFYAQDAQTKEFATYSLKLGVFEKGKKGMAYDFEDGDVSAVSSTYYYYGVVSPVKLSEENIGGNATKKVKIEVTDESVNGSTAREPQFYLTENNILQNISLTKSFSFDVYIEDSENRSFNLAKVLYYNWNDQGAAEVQKGTLTKKIASNRWETVTVTRENYESVLGGYIFGGSTLSLGGQAWTEIDDRLITSFYFVDSTGYKECGGINIYLDNFRVEV